MEYIRVTSDHYDELRRLQTFYKREIGEEPPTDGDFDSLLSAIRNENILFYACKADGRLVGCCSVCLTYSTFNYGRAGVFEDFYILPEYRHKGIARKLVRFAYEQSGVGSLTVGCADCDRDLYCALGFGIPLGNLLAFE